MTKTCSKHNKNLDYYCQEHRQKICSDCAIFNHKKCDVSMADMPEKPGENSPGISSFKELSEKLGHAAEILESKKSEMIRHSNDYFGKIKEIVNAEESKILATINTTFDKELKLVKEGADTCSSMHRRLQDDSLHHLSSEDKQSFNALKEKVDKVSNFNISFNIPPEPVVIKNVRKAVKVDFDMGGCNTESDAYTSTVAHSMEKMALEKSLGTEHSSERSIPSAPSDVHFSQPFPPSYDEVVCSNMPMPPFNNPSPYPVGFANPTSATGVAGVDPFFNVPSLKLRSSPLVRTPSDNKRCKITAAAFLSNGFIALADKGNKKVKLLREIDGVVTLEIGLQESPFDVTEVTDLQSVAVSIPKTKQVRFYSIDNLGIVGKFINTEQPCNGLAYARQKLFVICPVTWTHSECIKVYDYHGNFLQKIKKDSANDPIISSVTEHLSIFPDSGNLVFNKGGFSKEALCITTDEGVCLWKGKVEDWTDMFQGYAVLGQGIVAILGKEVYYISTETSAWRTLVLVGNLKNPYNVGVSKDNRRIAITQFNSITDSFEHDIIKLFDVCN